jgi:ABC-type nitrate/sulfonate/bicarbonate transport system permease component
MVEYCTLIDRNTGNPRTETCNTLLSNNVVVKWYASMGLVLAFWGFIIDFIMGTLLVIAISRVRRIRKALDGFSKRYRNRAYNAFAAWALLLALVTALAFVHAFHPAVYNTVHINSIVNLLIEVINTLQVSKYPLSISLLLPLS